jgi:molybdenum cofactor biosynthesis protein B
LARNVRSRTKSIRTLKFVVVTVSTSKYSRRLRGVEIHDDSGDLAERIIHEAGGIVASRWLISDDTDMLRARAKDFLSGSNDVAIFVGGTGVSPDDVTIESVRPFFEKELEGFGEIFRQEGFESVGTPAYLTRATAGIARGKLMACLPGSPDAVATSLRTFAGDFGTIITEARS